MRIPFHEEKIRKKSTYLMLAGRLALCCFSFPVCFLWFSELLSLYRAKEGDFGVRRVGLCGNKAMGMGGKLVYTSPLKSFFCMASDKCTCLV